MFPVARPYGADELSGVMRLAVYFSFVRVVGVWVDAVMIVVHWVRSYGFYTLHLVRRLVWLFLPTMIARWTDLAEWRRQCYVILAACTRVTRASVVVVGGFVALLVGIFTIFSFFASFRSRGLVWLFPRYFCTKVVGGFI